MTQPGDTPLTGANVGPAARVSANSRATLVLAALAVLLAAADTYVIVLALPDLMVSVGLDTDELQRAAPVVSVFLLGYIAMLPLIGRLSDLYGRSPVLIGCLLIFALGCLVTASADTLPAIVTGRFLQGAGGGGLVPATLALVADLWPAERRGVPLGIVGAVQELGSVAGPVVGAVILALADWRAIFWFALVLAVVLAAGLWRLSRQNPSAARATVAHQRARPQKAPRNAANLCSIALVVIASAAALLAILSPTWFSTSVALGSADVPLAVDASWTRPIVLLAIAAFAAAFACQAATENPLVEVRRLPDVVGEADLAGALLIAVCLGGIVLTFATADPLIALVSPQWPLYLTVSIVSGGWAWWRARHTTHPLIAPGVLRHRAAYGSLLVSLFVGAALIAALVEVPVYTRAALTGETQADAAAQLLRFLIGLPLGAVLGGWLTRRSRSHAVVAASGLLLAAVMLATMTRWQADTINGTLDDLVLFACGVGFGVAVAPVNGALLAATIDTVHGLVSALLVVARMVGMLVGLSVLTALGLRAFYAASADVQSPAVLCPSTPTKCPEYSLALQDSALAQVHASLAGAAACALIAAVLALVLLRPTNAVPSAAPVTEPTTSPGVSGG